MNMKGSVLKEDNQSALILIGLQMLNQYWAFLFMNEFTEIYEFSMYVMDIESFFMRISECGNIREGKVWINFHDQKRSF